MDPSNPYQAPGDQQPWPQGGPQGQDPNLTELVNKRANTALVFALIGLVCCGIIFGALALQKVNEAKALMIEHDIHPGPSGILTAAKVIAIIDIVFFFVGLLVRFAECGANSGGYY